MSNVLALIPARGGSKSIPDKNIAFLNGKPLIAYSIENALSSKLIDRVIVSTDSEKIAEVARNYGAEVPFLRPGELAQDDTLDLPVFEHALQWLKDNESYIPDLIVHLRPTSPIRSVELIDDGIKKILENDEADALRAVCSPSQNPFKMWKIKNDGFLTPLVDSGLKEQYNMPRQALPEVYWQNGYLDITKPVTVLEKKSMTGDKIIPLVVSDESIIDIDNQLTLNMAEEILKSKGKK